MARRLTNRSQAVQCLKKPLPGGNIGGLYSATINLKPGESTVVTDAEYAGMRVNSEFLTAEFIEDNIVDSEEDVIALGGGGGGSSIETDLVSAITGDGAVNLASGTLTDTSGQVSVEWSSRTFWDGAHGFPVLSWANGAFHLKVPDGSNFAIDWGSRQAANSSSEVTFDWQSLRLLTDGTDAVHWGNRNLTDSNGGTAANWENRILRDPSGKECMDWEAREMRDPDEEISVDWENRELSAIHGGVPVVSVNWGNQSLLKGGVVSIDWGGGVIYDINAGKQAINWDYRLLVAADGITPTVNWANRALISNVMSVDWGSGALIDIVGENLSLNWNTRELISSSGTNDPTLNWGFREMYHTNGTITVNWNNQYLANENGETAFSWNPSMQANTTAARPVGLLATGFMYFDTTLGKPIWWTGVAWVDATGTVV